ncbi:nucleotidyl transferase AbiEii/AbiGii toxin family protein [Lysinibacillus xylanilyticus]|uniref:nucleotidyl transferase AbiEii/AbiGii toxin family protein n=1 Tax=Lysinibacillus xylanilyticus TaxID=582475 RepID=UPI0038194D25
MNLHTDDELFKQVIANTAATYGLEEFQVEKDYYVSVLLKKIAEVSPDIVFKGGTSLSKCYDVINRFSEDIDLTINVGESSGVTQSQKRKLKQDILQAIAEVGMRFVNEELQPPVETRSRRDFNRYFVKYSKSCNGEIHMMEHIIVETNVTYKPFPCDILNVSNYITKYLLENGETAILEQFDLFPFPINVQKIDRTFIDKIFAICDYHELGTYDRYSRHIYDIHKIWINKLVEIEGLKGLLPDIIEVRKQGRNTFSCQDGYELVKKLEEIINSHVYRKDYDTNTREFLSEELSYEVAISSLIEILDSGLLPQKIA